MKHLLALVFLFTFSVAAFADNPPPITALQALNTAQKSMTERGFDKEVFIESVTLNRAPILGGEEFWIIKYSHPVSLPGVAQQEVGLKIRMSGEITRLMHGLGK